MNFRSSGEARSRRQFAERQILQIRELLRICPEAVPTLYPGYTKEVQRIADRLYVPNIEIKNGAVHARTPRAYRTKDAIGVIALHSGESLVMDRWLLQSSERQRQQQQQFLATHTTDPEIRIQGIQSNIPDATTETLGPDTTAQSWRYDYRTGTPFFDRRTGATSYVGFRYMSPLAVNMEIPQDPATSMHEIDHLVELDGSGIGPDDLIYNRDAMMTSEQRGHHVGRIVGDYLLQHDFFTSANLTEQLAIMRAIDDIRIARLGEGQFGFSHELARDYHEAGLLDHMLTQEYQARLRL